MQNLNRCLHLLGYPLSVQLTGTAYCAGYPLAVHTVTPPH